MGIERRVFTRIKTIDLVSYESYETTKTELMQGMGKTIDLSLGGVCFESTHALPLGSRIKLSFALGDKMIEAEGTIVSLNLTADLHVTIHVKFDSLSDDDKTAIQAHLDNPEEETEE